MQGRVGRDRTRKGDGGVFERGWRSGPFLGGVQIPLELPGGEDGQIAAPEVIWIAGYQSIDPPSFSGLVQHGVFEVLDWRSSRVLQNPVIDGSDLEHSEQPLSCRNGLLAAYSLRDEIVDRREGRGSQHPDDLSAFDFRHESRRGSMEGMPLQDEVENYVGIEEDLHLYFSSWYRW